VGHFESVCQAGKKIKTKSLQHVRTPSVDYDIKVVTLVPMNTVDSKKSRHVYATMNIVGEKMSSFFGLISLSWHVPSGFTVVLVYIFSTWMVFVKSRIPNSVSA
jgi:hypothetical protein